MWNKLLRLATLLILVGTCHAAPRRVAVLPSFSDHERIDEMRAPLATFDSRLMAELLTGWDVEVLTRGGLSAIVFEQKLRATTDAKALLSRVLPADVLVVSVYESQQKEMRIYTNILGNSPKIDAPKVFKVRDPKEMSEGLPSAVAKHLATLLRLPAYQSPEQKSGPEGAKKIVCALLEPMNAGGLQLKGSENPQLMRAALEQQLVSDKQHGIELVDRAHTEAILHEATLVGTTACWNANAAAQLGRLLKSDIMLVPYVSFRDEKSMHTDLFAVDSLSGRALACAAWTGPPLDGPPEKTMQRFLRATRAAALAQTVEELTDDPQKRHAEAQFMIALKAEMKGLLEQRATELQRNTRLADAAFSLGGEDLSILRKVAEEYLGGAVPRLLHDKTEEFEPNDYSVKVYRQMREAGQIEPLIAEARRVFELPLLELARFGTVDDKWSYAWLLLNTGRAEQALTLLTAGSPSLLQLGPNAVHYEQIAQALFALHRYKECLNVINTKKTFSRKATYFLLDSYRAIGDEKRELSALMANTKLIGTSPDRIARLINLCVKTGRPAEAVNYCLNTKTVSFLNEPPVRLPLIKALDAAGLKDLAISSAQCELMMTLRERDKQRELEVRAVLQDLGAEPLKGLRPASDYVTWPSDSFFQLWHDETIDHKLALEVAEKTAAFWGCPVKVSALKLEATKLSFYHPVAKSWKGQNFADFLLRANKKSSEAVTTLFLTDRKLYWDNNGYRGIMCCYNSGNVQIITNQFLDHDHGHDKRPIALKDTIVACRSWCIRKRLQETSRKSNDERSWFIPFKPDTLAWCGAEDIIGLDLGVSPQTGALLRSITGAGFASFSKNFAEETRSKLIASSSAFPDAALAADLAAQLAANPPIVVKPSTPGADR
jgi:hypothetical protein